MAARSTGSLTVAFGLVSIACKIYAATSTAERVKFNLLATDGARLKQQYVNESTGAVVPREEMLKGYEFAKGQFVTFTPAELKAMEDAGTHMAEIVEFVPIESVDPVYFEKSYHLAPDKGGAKPYSLLRAALGKTGRCAIGKWAVRGKQHIVLLRPIDGGIAMQVLLYGDEVRSIKDLGFEPSAVGESELALAIQLIEAQARDAFDPTQYRDEVGERIKAAIEQRVQGKELVIAAPTAKTAEVFDLAAALKASLAKSQKAAPEIPPTQPTTQSTPVAAPPAAPKKRAKKLAA